MKKTPMHKKMRKKECYWFKVQKNLSSLTAGPNMDRKLNKNWNDVSTETEKNNCLRQLQKEEN